MPPFKKLLKTPAILFIGGAIFFLAILWPYASFIEQELLDEPYEYWFIVWFLLILVLYVCSKFIED